MLALLTEVYCSPVACAGIYTVCRIIQILNDRNLCPQHVWHDRAPRRDTKALFSPRARAVVPTGSCLLGAAARFWEVVLCYLRWHWSSIICLHFPFHMHVPLPPKATKWGNTCRRTPLPPCLSLQWPSKAQDALVSQFFPVQNTSLNWFCAWWRRRSQADPQDKHKSSRAGIHLFICGVSSRLW